MHIRRSKVSSCSLLALSAAAGLLATSPAHAQGEGEATVGEIVVTAQRRSELSREVPITMTTMSAAQLEQADVQQLADITKLTPGLRFDYNGGFAQPTIRGVGVSTVTSGMGSNVGIYTDGFYSPNPLAANFDLMNVQSVQVLKGPQGTLFGRNTTGGAILVTTAKPSHDAGGMVEASYGRFDTQRYQAYATAGLTDNLAVDIEGLYGESDGFLRNIVTDDKKAGRTKSWGLRVGAQYDPTDKLSVLFRYQHAYSSDPTTGAAGNVYLSPQGPLSVAAVIPGAIVPTKPGQVANDQQNRFFVRSNAFQLTATYDLNFATLTSYTQWRKDYATTDLDFDGSNVSTLATIIPVIDKTFTQEFLLASKGEGPLQWTTGLFLFKNDNRFRNVAASVQGSPYFPYITNGTVSASIAGYFDVTYEVMENLFVTAGLRYSRDEVQNGFFEYAGFPRVAIPTLEYDRATPRLVVRYKPDGNSSVYASFTQGYKAPILSVGGGSTDALAPEKITAYEAGYKYGRGPLSFDVSAYHYDYKDLQVTSWNGSVGVYRNAGKARVNGVEGQVRYQVAGNLHVNAGAGYTDAKFKSFPTATGYVQCLDLATCGANYGLLLQTQIDASGFRMPRAPKFTGNAGVTYDADLAGGELVLSSNLYYTSGFYFDAANQFRQKGYPVLGLRAEWTDPSSRYTVAVFGNNVTGERYRVQVNPSGPGIVNMWSAPATYGASLRARF